jgi:hypothetical protein
MITSIKNSRKCKLICTDRNQMTACLGVVRKGGMDSSGPVGTFGIGGHIHFLHYSCVFIEIYMHQSSPNCILKIGAIYCIPILSQ